MMPARYISPQCGLMYPQDAAKAVSSFLLLSFSIGPMETAQLLTELPAEPGFAASRPQRPCKAFSGQRRASSRPRSLVRNTGQSRGL